ncbi:MAG: hypothetical protein NT109_08755 [Flavobacteriia bacterium]|nr:hypothetical protein [Flavobacteriia bacterium]
MIKKIMLKSTIFILSAVLLILSSCNSSQKNSSDLVYVSKNIDGAIVKNENNVSIALTDIRVFQIENPDLNQAHKEKLQNTVDKIVLMGNEEKKIQDFLDKEIVNLKDQSSPDLDKIKSFSSEFLKSISSVIKNDQETKFALVEIQSTLNFSNYKLNGTKIENTLALKSIKLSVSNAYQMAAFLVKSMVRLSTSQSLGIPQ